MANNNAECQLFCSPLDPTGQHTIDASYRATMFASYAYSATGFTFLPRENVIKYPANADTLNAAGINYLRYKNPQYGNRWIYCFVRSIEYAAPETAILHIERDAWVTWVDNITPNQAYIERQRVSTVEDTAGANLLPEAVSVQTYLKAQRVFRALNQNTAYSAVICGWFNVSTDDDNPEYVDPNATAKTLFNEHSAKAINGCAVGGNILVTEQGQSFNALIRTIAILGGKVVAAFPLPSDMVVSLGPVTVTDRDGSTFTYTMYTYSEPLIADTTTLSGAGDDNPWGFTPKNKKLFTYPYIMLSGSDHAGGEIIYKYDEFTGNIVFDCRYVAGANPSLVLNPQNYQGLSNVGNATVNNNVPQIPWDSNAYDNYMAENGNSLMFARIARKLNMGAAFVSNPIDLIGNIKTAFNTAMAEESEKARLQDIRGLGDTIMGVPSSNVQASFGQIAASVYLKYCSVEDAKRIDNFFSRFGYRVDKVATISWNKRSDYDYIKTQGANVSGTIPVDDKVKINALLNGGLTIFHSNYGTFDVW